MNFIERVKFVQRETNSLLCIGLDPQLDKIPSHLKTVDDPILEFNRQIILATSDVVCGYKLNLAFYEVFGSYGWDIFEKTLQLIPRDLVRIADGKRNDIGNSAERYANALLDELDFDAVTVNPYMGSDSVEPFLYNPEKGAFILVLTSNPGARDFQKLKVGKNFLYEKVVAKAKQWNKNNNVGLVVGATQPRDLANIRKMVPNMPILVPGVGAQGGDLEKSLRYGLSKDRDLLIVNVGRSIIYAGGGERNFEEMVRNEAERVKKEIDKNRLIAI